MQSDDFKISDPLNAPNKANSSLFQLEESEEVYISPNFFEKKEFLRNLIATQSLEAHSIFSPKVDEINLTLPEAKNIVSDSVIIKGWKNILSISARLLEYYDNVVILECLIDRQLRIYEEREFPFSLFEGYELKIGNLFYLQFFRRPHEERIEVHNDPNLTNVEDFPKMDFTKLFEKSTLFKK